MATPHPRSVDYFSVLARARHLLPEARGMLDHRVLVAPDRMDEAIRMCGTQPEWARFDAEEASHVERLIGAIKGDVYLIGDSVYGADLQVLQAAHDELESIRRVVDFGFDVTLIGVTAPIIGLVHHEALCTVVDCIAAPGAPEDPRDLEVRLREEVEQRRQEALSTLAPPVQQAVLAILEDKRPIPAIKYLRTELGYSLADAKNLIDAIHPWWPGGLSTATGNRRTATSGGEN